MKHFNEEELIEYHYGESDSAAEIKQHVRECAICGAAYLALSRDLSEIVAIHATGSRCQLRRTGMAIIRSSVQVYEAPKKQRFGWLQLHLTHGFAAAACLLVLAAAFFAGRRWEHRNPQAPTVTKQYERQQWPRTRGAGRARRSPRPLRATTGRTEACRAFNRGA